MHACLLTKQSTIAPPPARVQQAFNRCLKYWLHDSIASLSILRTTALKYNVSTWPLHVVAQALASAGIICDSPPSSGKISTVRFATVLADYLSCWKTFPFSTLPGTNESLPLGKPYQEWLSIGGAKDHFSPVHKLDRLLGGYLKNLFLRATLHGSLATLDPEPGFSDMDTAFILPSTELSKPGYLLRLRQASRRILCLTYAYDPFMHHGPFYLLEPDLQWYPEPFFPLVLFSMGTDLLTSQNEMFARKREDFGETLQMIRELYTLFISRKDSFHKLSSLQEMEWILGSVLLLPALFLQLKTGVYRYKRDTFEAARPYFTSNEWEPVETASHIRKTLLPRPVVSRYQTWIAEALGVPGWIQRVANRDPAGHQQARHVASLLGSNYIERVLSLLSAMFNQLQEEGQYAHPPPP